ncbi:hypothetical protein BD779DRAFT_1486068 [Infundibulicybe gibba]|nr:hypothetical protein BD779DRAFT_1486068 [Infundibulicybe gibba]
MKAKVAEEHERSADHMRQVEASTGWGNPTTDTEAWTTAPQKPPVLTAEEIKMRDMQIHVDQVRDMVPFWIHGVQAAEHGELPKLEAFLEQLSGDPWEQCWEPPPAGPPLSETHNGWGAANWSVPSNQGWGDADENRGWISSEEKPKERDSFVEAIAKQLAVDEERKRRMHDFFKMPTEDKLRQIERTIRLLSDT